MNRITDPIETSRLLLRELGIADAEDFYLLNLDPEVLAYTNDLPFRNVGEARIFLSAYDQYKRYGVGRWAVIDKTTNDFLGWCGLRYSATSGEYDLGFRFFKKHWGKGFATEAAKTSVDLGFRRFKLKKIIGRAMVENKASIRVLEKTGMIYDRHFDFDGKEGISYKLESDQLFE